MVTNITVIIAFLDIICLTLGVVGVVGVIVADAAGSKKNEKVGGFFQGAPAPKFLRPRKRVILCIRCIKNGKKNPKGRGPTHPLT